jgi:hypothetical protein
MSELRSERIEVALEDAITKGASATSMAALFDQLERASGLPEARWGSSEARRSHPLPRPNIDLARAVGSVIVRRGRRAEPVLAALIAAPGEFPKIIAASALAERWLTGVEPALSMRGLQDLVEDGRHLVRIGVIDALRSLLNERGPELLAELASWTDGYLQAHVALEALADKTILSAIRSGDLVLARLNEAFVLADLSPRAAERSQGLRLLRQELPAQIAMFAARFPETLDWLLARTGVKRPETREVADAARLSAALEHAAPPPRDLARIVQGTRKRSKGRRS